LAQGAVSVDIYAPRKRQKRGKAASKTRKNLAKSLISGILPHLRPPRRAVHSIERKTKRGRGSPRAGPDDQCVSEY
jgi:hypothetical protein